MSSVHTCETCKHCFADIDPQTKKLISVCKKFPPAAVVILTQQGTMVQFMNPIVIAKNQQCSFHEVKLSH